MEKSALIVGGLMLAAGLVAGGVKMFSKLANQDRGLRGSARAEERAAAAARAQRRVDLNHDKDSFEVENRVPLPVLGREVWDLNPFARGRKIERYLAETEYKDWQRTDHYVDQVTGAGPKSENWPGVDFQKGLDAVSLKTTDTRGKTWADRMKLEIDKFADFEMNVGGRPINKSMDVRVQPGGLKDAHFLIQYAQQYNIPLTVREIGR